MRPRAPPCSGGAARGRTEMYPTRGAPRCTQQTAGGRSATSWPAPRGTGHPRRPRTRRPGGRRTPRPAPPARPAPGRPARRAGSGAKALPGGQRASATGYVRASAHATTGAARMRTAHAAGGGSARAPARHGLQRGSAAARLAAVVDHAVHAERAQALRLGRAAGGGDHAAAGQQRQLRAKVARAARGRGHERGLALAQRPARHLPRAVAGDREC